MSRRYTVDFALCPGLSHIRAALEQHDIADTHLRSRIESIGQHHLGTPVIVDVPAVGVQRSRHIRREHVPCPSGILEPRQFRRLFVDGDHVFLPVAAEIDRDQLIAKLQ